MRGPWFVLGALCLLIGCRAVGPDYEAPELESPDQFGGRAEERLSAQQVARWWETLADPQLSGLVADVLASNLDLSAAVKRIEASYATYGVTRAALLPSVDATAGYSRANPLLGSEQDQWTVGGLLSWEIDLFGRVRRSVEASRAGFEADVEDLRAVQVALGAETVGTYLQILSLNERLDIARRNVEGQERSLEIAEQRFGAGMTAGLDPAQARVNLHSTQASVPVLELELRRALHRLSVLSAEPPRSLGERLATQLPLPAVPDELMVGVPADLLRNRPDVRALERRLASQSARVGVATAALYPSIRLSGSWDWLAGEAGDLIDEATGVGNIGPLVSLPIFNAGQLRSQVEVEEATLQQLDLQLRQALLVAQEEVENALVAIVRDRRRAQLLEQAVGAARDSVELSRQLYTSGQSDFQNVLDAQRSLFALEDDSARARLATLLDLVELYRAVGGGWGATPH